MIIPQKFERDRGRKLTIGDWVALLPCLTDIYGFGRLKMVNVKSFAAILITLSGSLAFAQQTAPPTAGNGGPFSGPLTLASEFLENNFVNLYAFGSGLWDSYAPVVQNGQTVNNGGFGVQVGGGVNAWHQWRNSSLSLSYRGDYNNYSSGFFSSGTNQNLSLGYNRRLSRRWYIGFYEAAGIWLYGGTVYGITPYGTPSAQLNPFSPETRWLSSSVSMTYQQSRRLSYSVGGNFFLSRYNYTGAIGVTGGSGSGSFNYRLTARTNVGGSYVYSDFRYQQNAGSSQVHSLFMTIGHVFSHQWSASFSAGLSLTHSVGTITIPVTFISNGLLIPGYEIGSYNQHSHTPYFAGLVSHSIHRSNLYVSAGQSVAPGNGFYLASRNQFISSGFSRSLDRRSNVGFALNYNRNTSISNTISGSYSTLVFTTGYSRLVARHISGFLHYDFVHYGNIAQYSGVSDNRITFGVSIASKNIPLTLY